ncbi:MAG: DUF6048 family protein [Bacteroidaceae bacterium]|nr:DUF6048 family protein [Bacteroidaceae bacterium]
MELLNRHTYLRLICRLVLVCCVALLPLTANSQSLSEAVSKAKAKVNEIPDSLLQKAVNADSTIIDSIVHEVTKNRDVKRQSGFSIAADIFNPIMMFASDYGQIEGALKVGIKDTYYPTLELGLGKCDMTDDNSDIGYKVTAPFIRIGLDYNVLDNKHQRNKLFAGFRYGLSSFEYEYYGPGITDPLYGGNKPYKYTNQKSTCHWLEFIVGIQAQIWHGFHMGWSVRYKTQLSVGKNECGKPYYIPGYGTTTNSSCWGATYNLIWDVKL